LPAPASAAGFGGLILYFDEFVPRYLRKTNGAVIGRRAAQMLAKRYDLPLVWLGNTVFIDEVIAADRLREAQLADRTPRRPGRPPRRAGRCRKKRGAPPDDDSRRRSIEWFGKTNR